MAVAIPSNTNTISNISANLSNIKKDLFYTRVVTTDLKKSVLKRNKIKSESIYKSKFLFNRRIDASKRRESEDYLEASNISSEASSGFGANQVSSSSRSPLGRILSALGFITAGWLIRNLPTWIALGREFVARIYLLTDIGRRAVNNIFNFVDNIGSIVTAYAQNIASFDFFDTSSRVKSAFDDLDITMKDINKSIEDAFTMIGTPLNEPIAQEQMGGDPGEVPGLGSDYAPSELYPENAPFPGPGGPAKDLVSGARSFMSAGFPIKGAAYLAGNAQTESEWQPQRKPWVISWDGAGTNKGLMSWNRGRISRAEKYLGKPLETATAEEQVRFVRWELQNHYPAAYKIFMNPNASHAQLVEASKIYLGYGKEGARYGHAKKALEALQKGGSTPPRSTPLQSSLPSLPPTNTLRGQAYGASREGGARRHAGQDFDISGNEKFYSRIGGEVIFAGDVGGAYGNVVDIYNKELNVTERIAEALKILPGIRSGVVVQPGQAVVQGERTVPQGGSVGVIHYEIRKGKSGPSGSYEGTINPLEFLKGPSAQASISARQASPSISRVQTSQSNIQPTTGPKTIVAVDTRPTNVPNQILPSHPSTSNEYNPGFADMNSMLNRFIKTKFLTDLAYL
jgi:hypothetical protein